MATARKSVRSIRTMAGLVDRRRSRTTAGALLEMSVLANEKERLSQELAASQRRRLEINRRLAEIVDKEGRLHAFLRNPAPASGDQPATSETPSRRLKIKDIRY